MRDPYGASVPLYVYALVEPRGAPSDDLVLISTERTVAVCEALAPELVAAAVADADDLARLARRHDLVVRGLALDGPVLPVRMGTMCAPDRLAAALADCEADIAEQLARLRGRHEWRLRVEPGPSGARAAPHDGASETGTAYLLRRREELAPPTPAEDEFGTVDAVLRGLGGEPGEVSRFGRLGHSRSYLLPDRSTGDVLAALAPLVERANANGTTLEFDGPLPAYSFADVRLGAGS